MPGLKLYDQQGDVNGEAVHASSRILTDLLRKEMKLRVGGDDWEDIIRLYRNHKVAADEKMRLPRDNGWDRRRHEPYNTDFATI